jgi:hypothetical protein
MLHWRVASELNLRAARWGVAWQPEQAITVSEPCAAYAAGLRAGEKGLVHQHAHAFPRNRWFKDAVTAAIDCPDLAHFLGGDEGAGACMGSGQVWPRLLCTTSIALAKAHAHTMTLRSLRNEPMSCVKVRGCPLLTCLSGLPGQLACVEILLNMQVGMGQERVGMSQEQLGKVLAALPQVDNVEVPRCLPILGICAIPCRPSVCMHARCHLAASSCACCQYPACPWRWLHAVARVQVARSLWRFLRRSMAVCAACGLIGKWRKCAQCRTTYYCSVACQAAHHSQHRPLCRAPLGGKQLG